MKSICFVTTGDIKRIATSKRALGMANNLSDLGWKVYIIMEDTSENRHRVNLECDGRTEVFYFQASSAYVERKEKERLLARIKPDYVYICAFVFRNMVYPTHRCVRLVEHSELCSAICNRSMKRRITDFLLEYYSMVYADGVLNASDYLQKTYQRRIRYIPFKKNTAMLYLPYAYNQPPARISETELSEITGMHKAMTIFVYLGTVTSNYGIFTIIEAAKRLKEKRTDFCVVILGHGRDYTEAVKTVEFEKLQEHVRFYGFIEEERIHSFFSTASAFISPMNNTVQDWARCPSKIYMYLPYGKPIITCRIGEPLQIFGDKGMYYQPGDSRGMMEQMMKVVCGTAKCLSVDASKHTWETRSRIFDKWIKNHYDNV